MNYRIRFRQGGEAAEREVVVEAHSPTEAMVKFRCVRHTHARDEARQVTSVCPTEAGDSLMY